MRNMIACAEEITYGAPINEAVAIAYRNVVEVEDINSHAAGVFTNWKKVF